MEIILLLLLIIFNGALSMAEIAVVSSRKTRLQRLAADGRPGAKGALALHSNPSYFLSTIQIGITTVGILSGAIGETALADPLAGWLATFAFIEPHARGLALIIVVITLTYFAVVIGELVPKRLGLLAPEAIAALIASPMNRLAQIAKPLVWFIAKSSDMLLLLIHARSTDEPPITNDEIKLLMKQGADAGVFHASEQAIVSNVLRLDEQRIGAIMTHRQDIYALDLNESEATIRQRLAACPHNRLVVCRDGLDHILGLLHIADLLKFTLASESLRIEQSLRPPLYVPEGITITKLLENFRQARQQCALIVDEYGELQGLVTVTDVLTSIVGEIPSANIQTDQDVVVRADGSWLIDGSITIEQARAVLKINHYWPGEEENDFNTLGGFIMRMLGHIPAPADNFEWDGWRFEVMDMDHNRVDKVLVARSSNSPQ